MITDTNTTTTLTLSDRNELAMIRNDLAKALREIEPDTRALHTVVQRLDKLLAPAKKAAAAAEGIVRPVPRSIFAGW